MKLKAYPAGLAEKGASLAHVSYKQIRKNSSKAASYK